MRSSKRKHALLFRYSLVCSVSSSVCLLAAALTNSEGKHKGLLILFGLLFWLGLIFEQLFFWKANRLLKLALAKDRHCVQGKPGIISLAVCREGMVADILLGISLLALIVCMAFGWGEKLMQYIFICLMVLSFRLHCFLNGRNYKYTKLKERKVDRKNG